MRNLTVFIFICLTAVCVSAEDSANESNFPSPPEAVNARLPENKIIFFDQVPQDGQSDIELLAQIQNMLEYASVAQGDWERHWFLIKCEIIKKTVGQWTGKELNFICYDTWPRPESEIMFEKPPFPYLKGGKIHFWLQDSNGLPIIVGQKQVSPVSSYEKLKEGFKLTLIPLSEEFVIGKPMLFRLEMQNISDEKLELGYMSTVMVNNPLEIKDSNGNPVPYIDTSYQTTGAPKIFEPGEMVVLADNYDVRSQYHIIKPGRYSFQFKGDYGMNCSNIVEVDIKPGELSALEEIVEKLKPVLPKGWGLTRSMYPFGDLPEGEIRKTIMFHLIGKYPRKASGGQIIALSIFVNPTPAFLEKKYFDANLWGESIWGPVYLKNSNAELLWPDYKKQIEKALSIQISK